MRTRLKAIGNNVPIISMSALTLIVIGLVIAMPFSAFAQSMQETLSLAYANSASIEAVRRDLQAVEERLSQARAGYYPQADFSGAVGATYEFTDAQEQGLSASSDATLSVSQPLYRGGGTVALIDQAQLEIKAQEARLRDAEQSVLLETATTFMDVWRDQKTFALIGETLSLLETELDSVTRQQELGARTKTDVAQTEARLGQTEADGINAEANLAGSQTQYERLTSARPGSLDLSVVDIELPSSVDEALAMALAGNPGLQAAIFQKQAAERAVDVVSSTYSPSLDLNAALQYFSADIQEGGGDFDDDVALARVDLRLTVPLYRGGGDSSRVREAQTTAFAEERREEDLRRIVGAETRGAWTRMTSVGEQIKRLDRAVDAARRVVDGTAREYQIGKRTNLDLLNARRDFLDLQTTLVSVQRDREVAKFELLSAIGHFTSADLDFTIEPLSP